MNQTKLVDTLILSASVALFMIGVHQLFVFSEVRGLKDGVMASYWIFMLVAALIMWLKTRKDKQKSTNKQIAIKQDLPSHKPITTKLNQKSKK
jgi:hypothetical protein